jgi:hypothetical protein
MTEPMDENRTASTNDAPPSSEPEAARESADEAATLVQSSATPPPRRSWFRKRWVLIVGGVAAAAVLLFGGVALGAALDGHGDRSNHPAFGDGGQFRHDGPRSQMDSPGGLGRDGDGGWGHGRNTCPQPGATQSPATPQVTPSTTP